MIYFAAAAAFAAGLLAMARLQKHRRRLVDRVALFSDLPKGSDGTTPAERFPERANDTIMNEIVRWEDLRPGARYREIGANRRAYRYK